MLLFTIKYDNSESHKKYSVSLMRTLQDQVDLHMKTKMTRNTMLTNCSGLNIARRVACTVLHSMYNQPRMMLLLTSFGKR